MLLEVLFFFFLLLLSKKIKSKNLFQNITKYISEAINILNKTLIAIGSSEGLKKNMFHDHQNACNYK